MCRQSTTLPPSLRLKKKKKKKKKTEDGVALRRDEDAREDKEGSESTMHACAKLRHDEEVHTAGASQCWLDSIGALDASGWTEGGTPSEDGARWRGG